MNSWPSLSALEVLGASVSIGLLVLFLCLRFSKSDGRKGDKKLPPGPRPWPIVGNLSQLSRLLHQDFKKLSDFYGPIFHLRLGSVDTVVISSPTLAEEVLKTKDITFASRPSTSFGKIVFYDDAAAVVSPYGPYWRHARKVYTLQLITVKRIRQFEKERLIELLRALDSIISGCEDGKVICIDDVFWTIICNNICRMAFSRTYYGGTSRTASGVQSSLFEKVMTDMTRLMTAPILGDFIPFLRNFDVGGYKGQLKELSRQMDKILETTIEEHQHTMYNGANRETKDDSEQDLLSVLLTTPSSDNENLLTRVQVKALLQVCEPKATSAMRSSIGPASKFTFPALEVLGAGTEAQVTTLRWIFRELLKNPSILSQAQGELDNVVGTHRLVSEADLPHLPYIGAIVNESFRLHPSVPLLLPHQSFEASSLGNGYHIPKNTQVFINTWAMGRDPSLWENPMEFNPARFLNTNIDRSGQVFKFLPFGSGRRMCPGKQLAVTMLEYSLAVLLHACDWALPQGVSPKEVDMREGPGITAPPIIPLEVRASPRLPLSVIFAAQ